MTNSITIERSTEKKNADSELFAGGSWLPEWGVHDLYHLCIHQLCDRTCCVVVDIPGLGSLLDYTPFGRGIFVEGV